MKTRLRQIKDEKEIIQQMRALGVDEAGIKIMSGKGLFYVFKVEEITAPSANVLKQEMLSLGGEVAVSRNVITGKTKRTACLMMGTVSQYTKLLQKLKQQPWGLDKLAWGIKEALDNSQHSRWKIKAGRFTLDLGKRTYLMGILNITPDSFSDGGRFYHPARAIEHALRLERDGADIIDIGGESTRPEAGPVTVEEELKRVIPVIKILGKRLRTPISVDTRKARVAREAIEAGATMVNDVSGLRHDPEMKKVVAHYRLPLVLMHMKGAPRTMQRNPRYKSLISEITDYLEKCIELALEAGISRENTIIDPGIGFGKTLEHNLAILRNLQEFRVLGRPILVGTSRKSFIGKLLNLDAGERIYGTVSSSCLAVMNGANILRIHDVKEVKQAVRMMDAIIK